MESEIITGIVSFLLGSGGGWFGRIWQQRTKLKAAVKTIREVAPVVEKVMEPVIGSANKCAICGNPPNPVRFHDGRWLCSDCKGK